MIYPKLQISEANVGYDFIDKISGALAWLKSIFWFFLFVLKILISVNLITYLFEHHSIFEVFKFPCAIFISLCNVSSAHNIL